MYITSLLLLPLLLPLLVLAADVDYYNVLGIPRTATPPQIKKAYRTLSRKYHPDKNTNPDAEDKFIQISSAYEVLSSDEKKAIYDRYGVEGLKQNNNNAGNPFDMFSNFFGRRQGERRGPDQVVRMEVDLKSMYTGNYEEFSIPKRVICEHCSGSGANSPKDIHPCSTCQGQGMIIQRTQIFPGMFTNMQSTCPTCQGRGKQIARACSRCKGEKVQVVDNNLSFYLPPGAAQGWEMNFEQEADESPEWDVQGDVIVRVYATQGTGEWRRKDAGLYKRETISVDEALLGFERRIMHLDGSQVQLKREGTTQPGHVDIIKGQGMPPHAHLPQGDLYVEYTVLFPTSITPDTRTALEKVFEKTRSGRRVDGEL